jgi:cytoskeleton protein RodZ
MSLETANINDTDAPGLFPGAELKAQREAAGHSLVAIATATRITRSKLTALEADDYEKLGGNTFVIGYIRQYAKWLGVDADPLVQAFEQNAGEASREQDDDQLQQESAYGKRHFWKTVAESDNWVLKNSASLLWVAAALLALVFLVSVVSKDSGNERPDRTADVTQEPLKANPVEAIDDHTVADAPQTPEVEASSAATEAGVEAEQASEAVSPAGTDGAVRTDEIADVPMDSEILAPAPPAEKIESAPLAQADSAVPEPMGTDQLAMSFSGPCWVEITDADGDLLFARLQEASDNLQLVGKAPFEIMLGNARAVTLLVNGNLVSTDPGPNRDTLRFTAGP